MIKEISFFNWKSFKEAKLQIDPLTVLIGTNASGKSNALDGLRYLNRIAEGKDLAFAFHGDTPKNSIRGGAEWAALKPNKEFKLEALIQESVNQDYLYSITVQTIPEVKLTSESITRVKYRGKSNSNPYRINLYTTDKVHADSPSITARLYNRHRGTPKECSRTQSILTQLKGQKILQEITEGIDFVRNTLSSIFVLDPTPALMRSFVPFSNVLEPDASNIAGVLAALPRERQNEIVDVISKYTTKLPERDIQRVWAEPVGKFRSDAMLYCEEIWEGDAEPSIIDARSMSDGTLRFVAILTALLTRPDHSQIIIEEVDNGLHPSRAKLLLTAMKEIGSERNIDILVTTHNPALLDTMGTEMVPFVIVASRRCNGGSSDLILLEDIRRLPKLLAAGTLGSIATNGLIEESIEAQLREI